MIVAFSASENQCWGTSCDFAAIVILALGFFITVPAALAADANQRKVDQIFAAYDKPGSPGCAVGVIRDGNFIYRKDHGMGSLELGVPLASQSVFYMGSLAKQFTAASVALAAEHGFLSLDDSVRKYIPELPEYGRAITLRQMLHHTSGLRDFLTLLYLSGRHDSDLHSTEELLDLIVRQKDLNNVPGEEFIYSNTNYFLLGVVVQRATHKSLAEFAAANIFQPLRMEHTRFYDNHTLVVPGRVPAYDSSSNGGFLVDWSTSYDAVGGGGLMSTVDDLLFWDRNFDHDKLGKGKLLQEMQTRGVLNNGKPISYGFGLGLLTYRGLPVVEHNGALGGYRAEMLRFPEQRFTVVCLCNVSSAGVPNLVRAVANIYLEKNLQPEGDTIQSSSGSGFPDPSLFAGKYLDARRHFVYSFTPVEGNLMAWGANLRRVGPNQFRDLGTGTITFDDSTGGMKATLVVDGDAFFAGSKIEKPQLGEVALAEFAGQFRSGELDATYKLSVEKGSLTLRTNWNPPTTLDPVAPDEFDGDYGTLVFYRDTNHRINGFSVFTETARNVSFEKTN